MVIGSFKTVFVLPSFRFDERDGVVRRQRKFPLVTNSMQALKHFDIHMNYLILRMTNNIPFICFVFSCAIHCVLLEGATQLEGERSCNCSLLAVIYWITVLWSEWSSSPLLREGSGMGGLKSLHTNAYSQEQKEKHCKEAEAIHRWFPEVSSALLGIIHCSARH